MRAIKAPMDKSTPIGRAILTRHPVRYLEEAGIKTVADLEKYSRLDVQCISGIGPRAMITIDGVMKRFGLKYTEEKTPETGSSQTKLNRPDWDHYFMGVAEAVSARAFDPSIRVGCVITNPGRRIVATGYNAFPPGFPDDRLPLTRPDKYIYTVHAEANAIASSVADLRDGTLYCLYSPCVECTKLIITAGISRVVYREVYSTTEEALKGHKLAMSMFSMRKIVAEKLEE